MTRIALSSFALLVALALLPGCGGGGGEATFEPSMSQTPAEIQAAADYEKSMQEQQAKQYGGN